MSDNPIFYVGRHFTPGEFRDYVANIGTLGVYDRVFVHHTATDAADWVGKESLDNTFNYYESLGWYAGPHLFIADDGIWEGTPCDSDGIAVAGQNYQTRHIETVGTYSLRTPSGATLANLVAATAILLQKSNLGVDRIHQHRWYNQTECPGFTFSNCWEWFQTLVATYMQAHPLRGGESVFEPTPLEMALQETVWNAAGVPFNPRAALALYARANELGAPLTGELHLGNKVIQGFVRGIAYCSQGDWGNIIHKEW